MACAFTARGLVNRLTQQRQRQVRDPVSFVADKLAVSRNGGLVGELGSFELGRYALPDLAYHPIREGLNGERAAILRAAVDHGGDGRAQREVTGHDRDPGGGFHFNRPGLELVAAAAVDDERRFWDRLRVFRSGQRMDACAFISLKLFGAALVLRLFGPWADGPRGAKRGRRCPSRLHVQRAPDRVYVEVQVEFSLVPFDLLCLLLPVVGRECRCFYLVVRDDRSEDPVAAGVKAAQEVDGGSSIVFQFSRYARPPETSICH